MRTIILISMASNSGYGTSTLPLLELDSFGACVPSGLNTATATHLIALCGRKVSDPPTVFVGVYGTVPTETFWLWIVSPVALLGRTIRLLAANKIA
ncbi:MAG: hypothetical protein OXM02_06710 [Bacteroidota bacterium]|nr:hypothetical protein [Bacteroidota bacterium]MDE2834196.1 hypothetical protein [Bacteroidota bacterium]MDE2958332.1 hypothetical protein [Bacteroidota bacterium]